MTGYCKYCDSLIKDDDVIRAYNDDGRLTWVGCCPCYQKRIELMNNATVTK